TFSGFLGIQVLGDILSARPSNIEKSRANHYEQIYQKLELDTIEGERLKLSQLESPIVILNFWASWCQPCLMEFPSLHKLTKRFNANDVTIIGINGDEQKQLTQIKKIAKEYGLNYPQYADKDGEILNQFRVSALPMTIIYYQGKVLEVSKGVKNFYAKDLIEKFEGLIIKSKKKITLAR
ncbi:MAG: TlpA family protein disulfide reductase, partial [Bacteriovoracaceae bacterium]